MAETITATTANGRAAAQEHADCHAEQKAATVRRLKSAEGHLRGIARMVEEDTYCVEVIQQIRAVQAALDKVAGLTLKNHLDTCVVSAVRGDHPDERERVLEEILTLFETKSR